MKFTEWLYSTYPNPKVDGAWGSLHITVLLLCIAWIVASSLLLRKKSECTKRIVLWSLGAILLVLGITRRIVGFITATELPLEKVLRILLPRPGCAISCWLVLIALVVNKKFFYNFASIISIICAVIFFAYPSVGFNNEYILFENLYSIVTHSCFLSMAICFITYKFTDFSYKTIWKEGICLGVMLIYTFLEIYVMKIDPDPFYFLPENEVIEVLGGMSYALYLPLYLLFIAVYINAFYLIPHLKEKKK